MLLICADLISADICCTCQLISVRKTVTGMIKVNVPINGKTTYNRP